MIVLSLLYLATRRIYSDMVLISIAPDLAQTKGVDLKLRNIAYLTCIGVTVALGVRIVGGLMTAVLLAIPACTARNVSRNLNQCAYKTLAAGSLASVIGIIGFAITGIPAGPLIIIASVVLFLGSVFSLSLHKLY